MADPHLKIDLELAPDYQRASKTVHRHDRVGMVLMHYLSVLL